jgi:hypothetical protein
MLILSILAGRWISVRITARRKLAAAVMALTADEHTNPETPH